MEVGVSPVIVVEMALLMAGPKQIKLAAGPRQASRGITRATVDRR